MNTTTYSPALWYARVVGTLLAIVGVAGLAVNAEQDLLDQLFGLDINLTHNLVHLLTGIVGVAVGFWMITQARIYALVLGIVYAALGVWGLAEGATFDPFGLFVNINTADSVLHIALGVLGVAAWAMAREERGARAV